MAKKLTDIRSAARSHTQTALNTLVGVMEQKDAPPAARVAAANSLLDRGWGKAVQPVSGDGDGGPVKIVHTIQLVAKKADDHGED